MGPDMMRRAASVRVGFGLVKSLRESSCNIRLGWAMGLVVEY